LAPATEYIFTLTASLNNIRVVSPAFVVQTNAGVASNCAAGSVGSSCTPCSAGTYASPDNSRCIPCPAGTFNSRSSSSTSSFCAPCSSNTYSTSTGQKSSCTPCPANDKCLLGSASPLASTLITLPANSNTSSSTSESTSLSLGYQYLIAFFGLCLVGTVVCVGFQQRFRNSVAKMAGILRAPRWMFRVDDRKRLIELPSFARGLIGLYVLIGVVVVTAY